jgi:hypothetical protein
MEETAFSLLQEIKPNTLLDCIPKDLVALLPGFMLIRKYHENGSLKYKGFYKNRRKEGEWLYYYDNSEIRLQEFYIGGKLEGVVKMYDTSGFEFKYVYKDGRPDNSDFV